MTISSDEILAKMPKEKQDRIRARGRELVNEFNARHQEGANNALMTLRKVMGITQEELAQALEIRQSGVSRFEAREEHMISGLASYLEAMGGHLRLTADFDGSEIDLTDLIPTDRELIG